MSLPYRSALVAICPWLIPSGRTVPGVNIVLRVVIASTLLVVAVAASTAVEHATRGTGMSWAWSGIAVIIGIVAGIPIQAILRRRR